MIKSAVMIVNSWLMMTKDDSCDTKKDSRLPLKVLGEVYEQRRQLFMTRLAELLVSDPSHL